MGIQEDKEKARPLTDNIAEVLIDNGYSPNDFKEILSRMIFEEMEYIENQHND